jgi:uncharacterized membrane protein
MATQYRSRLGLTWARIRDSLWFIPAVSVTSATLLAIGAVAIPTPDTGSELADRWLFGGGAEGARGVLSAIAGGLITVTGTVFSVTIVALQLASSQFTPRVLRSFMADRVNQVVLGVFIGTFTYTLLVLRTIRSDNDEIELFVPHVAVTVALALLLVSVAALIVYINHAAQSVRVSVILDRETQRTLAQVQRRFPAGVGRPASPVTDGDHHPGTPDGDAAVIAATAAGYVQAVDVDPLWKLEQAMPTAHLDIRLELHVGAFAFPGKPLASVWPAHAADDRVAAAICDCLVLGAERTPEQDLEFGLVELSDIGVKALSTGLNDPTTAMHSIDRLTQVLAALAAHQRPPSVRCSPGGRVRMVIRDTPIDRAVGLAFDQIRHYGAGTPAVVKRLLEALLDLMPLVPVEARPALVAQAAAAHREARRRIEDPMDLAGVEQLAGAIMAASVRPAGAGHG